MKEELRGVVDAIAAAAGRREAAGGPEPTRLATTLEVLAQDYAPDAPLEGVDGFGERLDHLAAVFGLEDLDLTLLMVAAAGELDPNFAVAFSLLDGEVPRARPTVALALELAGQGLLSADARHRLGPAGPLQRFQLLELAGSEPFLRREVKVPDRVVAHLLGDPSFDPWTQGMLLHVPPVELPETGPLAAAILSGVPLCYIEGGPGSAGAALAASALEECGFNWLAVDLHRRPGNADLRELVAVLLRDAGLVRAGLVLVGFDALTDTDPTLVPLVAEHPVPAVAVSPLRWRPTWLPRQPFRTAAPALDRAQRDRIWRVTLEGDALSDDPGWPDLLSLQLPPEDIREAALAARLEASARKAPLTVDRLREAARTQAAKGSDALTRWGGAKPSFDDLILPTGTLSSLHELVAWARGRETVLSQGPVAGKGEPPAASPRSSPAPRAPARPSPPR